MRGCAWCCQLRAGQKKTLERPCRYITRPALVNERVQVNAACQVELKLKTPWRDGTTHQVMSPLEFMQRLAALVPRPRLASDSLWWPHHFATRNERSPASRMACWPRMPSCERRWCPGHARSLLKERQRRRTARRLKAGRCAWGGRSY
jgi:Putative transposase